VAKSGAQLGRKLGVKIETMLMDNFRSFAKQLLSAFLLLLVGVGIATASPREVAIQLPLEENANQSAWNKEKVAIQLKWKHAFQFAGFYAALEKGFYDEAGLDVSIIEGGPGTDFIDVVLSGKAQYGLAMPSLLLRRAKGDPLVVLATIFQYNPLSLISLAEKNIRTPQDLIGRNIMMGLKDDVAVMEMITREGVDLDAINITPNSFSVDDLILGKTDAISRYITDTPAELERRGVAFNVMIPYDYGVKFYGDSLFTTEDQITKHPGQVEAFRKASLKGWEYAMKHPEEIARIIHEKYRPDRSMEVLLSEAEQMKALLLHEVIEIGHINPQRWQHIGDSFVEQGVLSADFSLDGFIYEPPVMDKRVVLLTDEERAWLRDHPVISLSVNQQYPPRAFLDKGGVLKGISVDFARLFEQKLGLKIELVGSNWKTALNRAFKYEVDGIMNVAELEERKRYLNFTEVYISSPQAVLAHEREPAISGLDAFCGRKIGVTRKGLPDSFLRTNFPCIERVEFAKAEDTLAALATGQVDAVFGNYDAFSTKAKEMLLVNLKAIYFKYLPPAGFARIGLRKDKPILRTLLNKAIASVTNEERNRVLTKWYGAQIPPMPAYLKQRGKLELTLEERAWRDNHPVLRVGIAIGSLPLSGHDNDGNPVGIDIEYVNIVRNQTGIDIKLIPMTFPELLSSTRKRKIDLFMGFSRPERKEYAHFSDTLFPISYIIITRQDAPFIQGMSWLHGKKVSVIQNVAVHKYLAANHPNIELVPLASVSAGLKAVSDGLADAYVGDALTSTYMINKERIVNLKVAAPADVPADAMRFSIRSDWPELVGILNKVIASISPETHAALLNKWLSIRYDVEVDYSLLWQISIGFSIALVLVLSWNHVIRRQKLVLAESEAKLRTARDDAETANQAKSSFLANMSHELRTPLNAILGFSEMLGRDHDTTADQQEKLTIINRSGTHLLGMINDVLDLSKIEAGQVELEPEAFDLPEMLQDIGRMFEMRAARAHLRFNLELDPVLTPYIKTDIGKLRQILINLLGNALKFTNEGGFSLRARTIPMADDPAMVMLQLEVQDSGPGIPPEQLQRIFEPFVQAQQTRAGLRGTGLGLAISSSFVKLLGGEISVDSEIDKGSLFRVDLPVSLAGADEGSSLGSARPTVLGLEPGQPAWRILVVEDNIENRLLLSSLLVQVGFEIREAENGKEGVAQFQQWQPHFIWMDMRMPVMDGYEATTRIRELPGGDTVKIVAITASAFKEQRKSIMEAGCDEVMHKPFQAQEIFDAMADQLGVRYIYEESGELLNQASLSKLELEDLQGLSEEWLAQFLTSVYSGDVNAMLALTSTLAAEHAVTKAKLNHCIHEFQFQDLVKILEEKTEPTEKT
jgi:signal transduction histidine kinase/ABC-type nitrate/sulfonate/bicarbonate transport system substrate-binding protein/CheY-like chemotaxis protein